MTGQEAARRLARDLKDAKETKRCTIAEYVMALFPFRVIALNWLTVDVVGEDQYQNVWNVIIQDWNKKEEAKI